MRKLPIAPVALPRDLKTQANGKLDANILKPITGSKMHHLAAQAFSAMEAAAAKDKIVLKPTSSVDAYRPLAVQEKTFLARYDNTVRNSIPRSYNGKRWWLKPGFAPAAVPGTSNHGWGLAIDVADVNQLKVEWLLKNAATFGFSWELQNEPWHLRYVAGDDIPAAVAAWIEAQKPAKKAAAKKTAGNTYTVKSGDTLTAIAKRHGVTVPALKKANNIANPDRLSVGMVLTIPTK